MSIIKLSDGNKIPQIGYGTWNIAPEDAKKFILTAYKVGYHHIDTAQIYNNEWEIGEAIKKIKRNKLFITTKVWLPNFNSKEVFLTSIKQSLARLKVEFVDLLLLHWPVKNKIINAYKWLEEAKDLGYTKSIGVSNFMINHLEMVLKIAKYKPTINQIEIQPLVQQKKLVKFCQKHNIAITGYSNIKSYLNNELTNEEKAVLENIAIDLNKSVPQVILRWVYQEGIIIIPKSSSLERMRQNITITSFSLTDLQMAQIRALDRQQYTKADEIYEGHSWAEQTKKVKDFLFDKHF